MVWPNERVAALITLWARGWTMQRIAATLEITRGMVAGKLKRLGYMDRAQRLSPGERHARRKESNKKWRHSEKGKKWYRAWRGERRPSSPKRPPADVEQPTIKGVTILARSQNECAYPVGHHVFCGAPVFSRPNHKGDVLPTSWCPFHYNIVFKSSTR